jgi:ribosomal protein S18 acetylase RimI-like enzyme
MKRKYTVEISTVDPQEGVIRDALWKLLVQIDHEFVPPLSVRESTTEMTLTGKEHNATTGPRAYFDKLLKQNIIMAKVEEFWAGFLAFRHSDVLELLGEKNPCNYLTTIGVSPYYRNIGIARSMYRFALNDLPPELQSPFWATRTWSTNNDHIHLLNKIGFTLATKLTDHRGDGIDTHYYVYQMPEKFQVPVQIKEPSSVEQA